VFAEFETNLRRERQLEGITRAKRLGAYKGRKSVISQDAIRQRHASGMKPSAIAAELGISARSVFRLLADTQPASMQ
jgi:DNA invertase Pin-like site-specific DNA recombinase